MYIYLLSTRSHLTPSRSRTRQNGGIIFFYTNIIECSNVLYFMLVILLLLSNLVPCWSFRICHYLILDKCIVDLWLLSIRMCCKCVYVYLRVVIYLCMYGLFHRVLTIIWWYKPGNTWTLLLKLISECVTVAWHSVYTTFTSSYPFSFPSFQLYSVRDKIENLNKGVGSARCVPYILLSCSQSWQIIFK